MEMQKLEIISNELLLPFTEDSNHRSQDISNLASDDLDEKREDLGCTGKLREMHGSIREILSKSKKAKGFIHDIRLEIENNCDFIRNDLDCGKSIQTGFRKRSSQKSEDVNEEIRKIEELVRRLGDRVKVNKESIERRKKVQYEIKELMDDIENLKQNKEENKRCECKYCIIC